MLFPRFRLLALAVLAALTARADALYDAFRSPAPDAHPFVRWWWNGSRVDAGELVRELDVMHAAGIGGVEINTIGMPDSADAATFARHPAVPWLSPEWCRLVATVADAARTRNMTADLLVGSGWPFGGRFLRPEEQTQRVRLATKRLHGPARLEFTRSELLHLPSDDARRSPDETTPTRSSLLFVRVASDQAHDGAFAPGDEWLPKLAGDRLTIDVPAGDHTLYVGIWDVGFTQVKLGAPGADGPAVDHFNAGAVRQYLDRMATALEQTFGGPLGSRLRAVFVDSLELDHANWTNDLREQFESRRGYDLLPYLPYVLAPDRPQSSSAFDATVRRVRYDFCRTVVDLFHERFLATYVAWAHQHGLKARIQAYGRETRPLEGSMQVDLPEGESWLWLNAEHEGTIRVESTVANKYVASAANLTGQRRRSFEAMTNAVPVFWETLRAFKRCTDATFISGLNQAIIHGFNYTPPDAGFPGWVRFGNYLNERTPWWPYFHDYATYEARLGTAFRASVAHARIAVLPPRADEWAHHDRLYQPFPEVADPWYQFKLIDALQQAGFDADYLSADVLAAATVSDGHLSYGPCQYDAVIAEGLESIAPSTAAALAQFAATGGQVVFIGRRPAHAPGWTDAAAEDNAVHAALARLADAPTVHDLPAPEEPTAKTEHAHSEALASYAANLVHTLTLAPDVAFDRVRANVTQLTQWDRDRQLTFFVNTDPVAPVTFRAAFPAAHGRPYQWDPDSAARTPLDVNAAGQIELSLPSAGSALIVFDPAERPTVRPEPQPAGTPDILGRIDGPWSATFTEAGSGRTFRRTLEKLGDLSQRNDDLASFGGSITYSTDFDAPSGAATTLDLGDLNGTSAVTLNGAPLGSRWWGDHRYAVSGHVRPGKNHLEIRVTTVLANLMRSLRGNAAAQRWASWAPPISMGLLGPVRLDSAPIHPQSESPETSPHSGVKKSLRSGAED